VSMYSSLVWEGTRFFVTYWEFSGLEIRRKEHGFKQV
jgi:hypothetical protein